MSKSSFIFLMLSAMYENGGNTTQRLLDGHPELFVYPFESQPGTKYVNDYLSSMFPLKYRWPIFPNSANIEEVYRLIIDEEFKVRTKTPYVSKFRDAEFIATDDERLKIFTKLLKRKPLTRPNIMEAFFVATHMCWKNNKTSGKEKIYVGYSPIIGIDGNKIIDDFKGNGYVLHIVRNPFSAYADTKKRPVPLSIDHYMTAWNMCQYKAKLHAATYPDNFFIVRYEDVIADPKKILGKICKKIGISVSDTLVYPSWNGEKLRQVYPWGTIKVPTPDVNIQTAKELSKKEIAEIALRTSDFIAAFDYKEIYTKLK